MMVLQSLTNFINKRGKHVFYKEVLISLVLLSMPFWFLVYMAVPEVEVIETRWITIKSHGFESLTTMAWVIALKLYPITVLVIWFLTCWHWWRFALMVPIIFAVAQLVNIFTAERYIDVQEFWIAIIFAAPIIIVMLWISKKVNYYNSNLRLVEEIKNEIKLLLEILNDEKAKNINDFLKQFKKLKNNKFFVNEERYLTDLILLRNKINNNLKN